MEEVLKRIYGTQLEQYRQKKVNLPLYLVDGRQIFDVSVSGNPFILVNFLNEERLNVSMLNKQMVKYEDAFGTNIAFGFSHVSAFQRKALVDNRIPFVAGNEQVYLPFLGSCFSKIRKAIVSKKIEKLSPATQLLALFMLYSKKCYNKNEAAKEVGLSPMSVTRAVRDLQQIGLIKEEKAGNEILISFEDKQNPLSVLMPYLINPVQDIVFVESSEWKMTNALQAGEWSLAKRSMLSKPKYEEYALSKKDPFFQNATEHDPDLDENLELIRIQKWKYDPYVLSNGLEVDPISLFCSYQGEEDERIRMSLEEVQKEIEKWQIMKN